MTIRYPPARDALMLAAYALAVGAILLLIERFTADAIKTNEHKVLRQTLQAVLPAGQYNNKPLESRQEFVDRNDTQRIVYRAFKNGRPSAAAITASTPDGYAGQIDLIIGVTYQGAISGVRVLSHQETPGLGDKIDENKSPWILEFDGQSLTARVWKVRKDGGDFDQFTGATITPRAVVNSVKQTLEWYSNNRQLIFE